MPILIISDAEPDDLIALQMLLFYLKRQNVDEKEIFILSTLRNAAQSAVILDQVITKHYPDLRAAAGTSDVKPPFDFPKPPFGLRELSIILKSSPWRNIIVLILAPALDMKHIFGS
jgi:hypothetical protein